ncbi:hypothetical protein [Virgibacillus sp. L01]|uniref:hypothetical protein n=1 Tax=Virgibacillus sp. L01 TaxID=3457429 RepID=UPI003FD33DD8
MSSNSNDGNNQQQPECPEGCCQGDELLCVSIPCPVTIVLLGLELQLELPCIRLTSEDNLTPDQAQQILDFLSNLLGNLGPNIASQ